MTDPATTPTLAQRDRQECRRNDGRYEKKSTCALCGKRRFNEPRDDLLSGFYQTCATCAGRLERLATRKERETLCDAMEAALGTSSWGRPRNVRALTAAQYAVLTPAMRRAWRGLATTKGLP